MKSNDHNQQQDALTLEKRLANAPEYLKTEDKDKVKHLNTLKRVLSSHDYKTLLKESSFTGENLKCLREAIQKAVEMTEFEEQLEAVRTYNSFFGHSGNFWSDKVEGERICQVDKIFNPIETQIRLLKRLQGGEHPEDYKNTRADIAEEFGMSDNALDTYLAKLKYPGQNILGSHVGITLTRGTNNYDSTVHPVFLALNLSEVYMLTILLKKALGSIANEVVADIYRQLSAYAREKIDMAAIRDHVDLFDGKDYTSFPKGYRTETRIDIQYLLKSGELCCIGFRDDFPQKHIGILQHTQTGDMIFTEKSTEREWLLSPNLTEINSIEEVNEK